MTKILQIILCLTVAQSCFNVTESTSSKTTLQEIKKEEYELYKPFHSNKAVLVLFGGYPEKIEDVKREFKILDKAKKSDISVLFMNFNQTLWMEQNVKLQLADQLENVFKEHQLPTENIYIGGFSSGGNVALLLSNYLTKENSEIAPEGVFIVDSPIDLAALYQSSEKNIERNFSAPSVQESTWIIETLGSKFGDPGTDISKYEEYAVFTSKTDDIENLKNLRNTNIRLYTEPDTVWWKDNRMADFEQMNAYYIEKLAERLNASGFKHVEYISTKDKGYRASGERHPHSWSIVDQEGLIEWIIK